MLSWNAVIVVYLFVCTVDTGADMYIHIGNLLSQDEHLMLCMLLRAILLQIAVLM